MLKVKFPELLMLVHLWPVNFLYLNPTGRVVALHFVLARNFAFFTYEPLKTIISGRFFTIPDRNSLKRFALTHFSILNFAVKSEFEVNLTLAIFKDANHYLFWQISAGFIPFSCKNTYF